MGKSNGRNSKPRTIGILTAGGDCPGINAAIRGVGKTAIVKYGMKVIGISDGYAGLINKEYRELTESDLSGILTLGETILLYKDNRYAKPGESCFGLPLQESVIDL